MSGGTHFRIPAVTHLSRLRPVDVRNGSDAAYAVDNLGQRWVEKTFLGANQIVAEAVGWMLSLELRVPTPEAATHGVGAELTWLSRCLEPVLHWGDTEVHRLDNIGDVGRMLALDVVVGNWDRHVGNILLVPNANMVDITAHSIDLANSWAGEPVDLVDHRGEPPPVDHVVEGIPLDLVRGEAMSCAEEATSLDDAVLASIVLEACGLVRRTKHADQLTELLRERCQSAVDLTGRYLEALKRRP